MYGQSFFTGTEVMRQDFLGIIAETLNGAPEKDWSCPLKYCRKEFIATNSLGNM